MNRQDFQALSRVRLREARKLLDLGLPGAAYYLAGFSVECALKSCIAKVTKRYDFPPKQDVIRKVYTHDLAELIKAAGLGTVHQQECTAQPGFATNWAVVKEWTNESRYESKSSQDARDLYKAITNRNRGVLPWIRRHW